MLHVLKPIRSNDEFYTTRNTCYAIHRVASVGILGKERELGVGKLGWHGNSDMGFERNIRAEVF